LRAPLGTRTRPTSDRVREAMFSMLASMDAVEGADVLDLFAGSGALGVEALSRGAARVTFVDRDPAAVAAIRFNLHVLDELDAPAPVACADVLRYVVTAPRVDLVLADPPYDFDGWPALLDSLRDRTSLLVAETAADTGLAAAPGWETVKVRRYGGTVVTVVQPVARPNPLAQQEGEP
jgi:16S rRNA (guanine966-N2)-methyltransferase